MYPIFYVNRPAVIIKTPAGPGALLLGGGREE